MTTFSMYDILSEEEDPSYFTKEIILDDIGEQGKTHMYLRMYDEKKIMVSIVLSLDIKKTNMSKVVLGKLIESIRKKLIELNVDPNKEFRYGFGFFDLYIESTSYPIKVLGYNRLSPQLYRKLFLQEYDYDEFFNTDILSGVNEVDVLKIDPDIELWYQNALSDVSRSIRIIRKGKFNGEPYDLSDAFITPYVTYDEKLKSESENVIRPHFKKEALFNLRWMKELPSKELLDHLKQKLKFLDVEMEIV